MNQSTLPLMLAALITLTIPALAEVPKRWVITGDHETRLMSTEELQNVQTAAHQSGRCGGFMDITHRAPFLTPLPLPEIDFALRDPLQLDTIEPLLKLLSRENIKNHVIQLSAFPTRHYQTAQGKLAAEWIFKVLSEIKSTRTDVSVEFVKHDFSQPSVIARINASNNLTPQKIILGAHLDSISGNINAAPGADDDASGVATLIEIFRVLSDTGFIPKRTLEFMFYAGEEAGLLGSQAISTQYRNTNQRVEAVLQFDMTLFPGANPEISLISDYTSKDLNRFVGKLLDKYVGVRWGYDQCGYPCSDHASWTEAGFPASFPFETRFKGHNQNIHSPRDVVNTNLSFDHGLHFAKLGLSFAVELAQ